jgi:hypothetical protein
MLEPLIAAVIRNERTNLAIKKPGGIRKDLVWKDFKWRGLVPDLDSKKWLPSMMPFPA